MKTNNLNNDQHATAISDWMVNDIVRGIKNMILREMTEKGNFRIKDPVNKLLLNQHLKHHISDAPLENIFMMIENTGDEICDDMLEVMGPLSTDQDKYYVHETILLAKEKAKRKWVFLNTSEEYTKF